MAVAAFVCLAGVPPGVLRGMLAALVIAAYGCDGAEPHLPEGVSEIAVRQPLPATVPNPDFTLGLSDDGLYFHAIQDIAVDGRGFIYVSDRAGEGIRVFDSSGVYVRSIGRAGQGPGEFHANQLIAVRGDTLFVQHDGGSLSLFDTAGAFLSIAYIGGALATAMKMEAIPGALVLTGLGESSGERWRMSHEIMSSRTLHLQDMSVSKPFWRLPLSPMRDIGGGARGPDAGAAYPSVAASLNGRIYGTTGDTYLVEVRDSSGQLLETIGARVRRTRTTELDDRLAAQQRAGIQDPRSPRRQKYRAVLGEIHADAVGHLIVERRDLREDSMRVWDYISSAGWRIQGRVSTPPAFRLRRFAGCRLYGTVTDSLGATGVRRYTLRGFAPDAACER